MRHEPERTDAAREALLDEWLVVRCQLGEQAAFDALIERWHQPLWRYLHRLLGDSDAAAETLQDAWLRVLRALPRLRDPTRLRPWLFTIARRAAIDRLRGKYAEPVLTPIEDLDPVGPDEPAEADPDIEVLQEELKKMPLIEREALVLFYLEELSLEQLAEVLAVPVGTAKSRLFRARKMLRRQLTDKGVER